MAPHRQAHRPTERDNGMRRISSTTRWLAGAGVALVAAFTGFFAAQATSSNGSTSNGSTSNPAVTAPVATSPAVGDDGGSASQGQPVQTSPPVTYAPQPHTRTRGS